mmetsp:Transcript_76105/g.182011  ORF Transcript_76105/g.182011 Transcript_76105/m.182011 type:complete len:254 (-) Transcript_76105:341-1102(-)
MPRDEVAPVHRWQHARQAAHGAAARNLHFLGLLPDLLVEVGEPEVDDLQRRACAAIHEEYVLRLDVSVNDALVVAVLGRRKDLLHHKGNVALRHRLLQPLVVMQDAGEQVPSLAQLGDQVDVTAGHRAGIRGLFEVHLVHLHDVRVVQRLQQSDLVVHQLALKSCLHCHHLAGPQLLRALVPDKHHLAKRARAHVPAKEVVVEDRQAAHMGREHHLRGDVRRGGAGEAAGAPQKIQGLHLRLIRRRCGDASTG